MRRILLALFIPCRRFPGIRRGRCGEGRARHSRQPAQGISGRRQCRRLWPRGAEREAHLPDRRDLHGHGDGRLQAGLEAADLFVRDGSGTQHDIDRPAGFHRRSRRQGLRGVPHLELQPDGVCRITGVSLARLRLAEHVERRNNLLTVARYRKLRHAGNRWKAEAIKDEIRPSQLHRADDPSRPRLPLVGFRGPRVGYMRHSPIHARPARNGASRLLSIPLYAVGLVYFAISVGMQAGNWR